MGIRILSSSSEKCMSGIKRFSSGSSKRLTKIQEVNNFNPDPFNFKILKHFSYKNNLAIMINYPNCNTYEGNKIIVFKNTTYKQISQLKRIDPHFIEENEIKPFARFEPTYEGWIMACILLKTI